MTSPVEARSSMPNRTGEPTPASGPPASGWVGWIGFAALMMMLLGLFHFVDGVVALTRDQVYLVGESGLLVSVSYTTWGWVHVVGGVVVVLAGFGIMAGQVWARAVGVGVAMVSAVVNLAFLPAYPVWSLLMIALAVVVVMALTVHGSEVRQD